MRKAVKSKLCYFLHYIPDKPYIFLQYFFHMKKWLNLNSPKTFNEKLQWLKLYNRNDFYANIVDKYEVRRYVASKIGEEYLIPCFGVWEQYSDINFDSLPNSFVLKCTHDSGSIERCKDKADFEHKNVKKRLEQCLKINIFYNGREWAYKNVKPRIIAEQLMTEAVDGELKDYKIFCFNGVPQMIQVDENRFSNHTRNLYTPQWDTIKAELFYPRNNNYEIVKPALLDDMLVVASRLSSDFVFVRVDLYIINNQIYFGELTLYPGSGFEPFRPTEWDERLGELLILPEGKNENSFFG